jgi:hypothetical protein
MAGTLGRLTSGGSLPSGESFIYAFYVQRDDAGSMSIADLVAAADAWQNALKTGGTPIVTVYHPGTVWSLIQADLIDISSGHATERGFGTVSMLGTASSGVAPLPPGVSVAVTIRSTTAGPTGRGRFYLPAPNTGTCSPTGRLSTAALATISGAIANGCTALAGLTNAMTPCVYSRTHRLVHPGSKGDVGDVFDSMRTRRDKLVESRSPVFS